MPMHSRILPIYKRCQWRENIIVLSQFGVAWSRFLCYITRVMSQYFVIHTRRLVRVDISVTVCLCVCVFVCLYGYGFLRRG